MRVAVGSENPLKVEGVRAAFAHFYGSVDVVPCRPHLTIPKQPRSLREMLIGAIERAVHSLSRIEDADYGVGVEAGLFRVPGTITGYLKAELCVIVDREGGMTMGMSPSFEFPMEAVRLVIRGEVEEVEEVMERVFGMERIGERVGTIYYLTRGLVSRRDLVRQAVLMALVPRVNENLYKAALPKATDILAVLKSGVAYVSDRR
ncbi:MAG: inosine/xanthosine triphosphatase [Thermoprotei archaeon]|nr:MAG: inosine/xanthosine triphosphatase [Thermoprotei archaeon]